MKTSTHSLNSRLIDAFVQGKLRNLEANKLELRIEVIDHLSSQLELMGNLENISDKDVLAEKLEQAYLQFGGDGEVCRIHDEMNRIWSMRGSNPLNQPSQLLITILSLLVIIGLVYTLKPSSESQAAINNLVATIHVANLVATLFIRVKIGNAFFVKYHMMNTFALIPLGLSADDGSWFSFVCATTMTVTVLPQLWQFTIQQLNRYNLQLS